MMGYGSGWFLMFLGGLLVIGIIVLLIYFLVRAANVSGKPSSSPPHDMQSDSSSRALAILAERYARGEINDEEYRQKKSEITKN